MVYTFADHSFVVVAIAGLTDALETADRVTTSAVGADSTH